MIAVLISCKSGLKERKIKQDIEKRLEIDMKEYDVEFREDGDRNNKFHKDIVSVFLNHKTHQSLMEADKKDSGDIYIPPTGDICGKCWHVLYNRDSSKILNVMRIQ